MSFHDDRFPTNLSYGTAGGPAFASSVVDLRSGAREVVQNWAEPHYFYDAKYAIKTRDDARSVLNHFNAHQGAANTFPIKDFLDFASTANWRTPTADEPTLTAVSENDQQIGIGDGTTTVFQLIKRYTRGSYSQIRTIRCPITATVKVALNGVNQTSGWTVSRTTGRVTFSSAPGSGVVVTAGYEFDDVVTYDRSIDAGGLLAAIEGFDVVTFPSIRLVPDITTYQLDEDFPYRGSGSQGMAANMEVDWSQGSFQTYIPTGGGLALILPDETTLPQGGHLGWIANASAFSIAVRKFSGTALFTLPAQISGVTQVAAMHLGDISGTATWFWS